MREVIVCTGGRQYACSNGHEWDAQGEYTWNPWGDPDWRPVNRRQIECPECGEHGHRVERMTVRDDHLGEITRRER